MPASLSDIVNEMVEIGPNHHVFLDKESGELIAMNDAQLTEIDALVEGQPIEDWQQRFKSRRQAGEIIELPSRFEYQEYSIVERFCETVRDPGQRERLLKAIHGKRAFRDFLTLVRKLGLEDRWIGFRNRAFEEIAIAWLSKHGIALDKAA